MTMRNTKKEILDLLKAEITIKNKLEKGLEAIEATLGDETYIIIKTPLCYAPIVNKISALKKKELKMKTYYEGELSEALGERDQADEKVDELNKEIEKLNKELNDLDKHQVVRNYKIVSKENEKLKKEKEELKMKYEPYCDGCGKEGNFLENYCDPCRKKDF